LDTYASYLSSLVRKLSRRRARRAPRPEQAPDRARYIELFVTQLEERRVLNGDAGLLADLFLADGALSEPVSAPEPTTVTDAAVTDADTETGWDQAHPAIWGESPEPAAAEAAAADPSADLHLSTIAVMSSGDEGSHISQPLASEELVAPPLVGDEPEATSQLLTSSADTDVAHVQVHLDAVGNLLVTSFDRFAPDSAAHAGGNDALTLRNDPSADEIVLSSRDATLTDGSEGLSHELRFARSDVTGQILVDLGAGDDTLTVDFTAGDPVPVAGLLFDGGEGGDDALRIIGGDLEATYAPGNVFGDGTIAIGDATLHFFDLEPLDFDSVGTFTLNLPGLDDEVTIENGTLLDGFTPALMISGTSGGIPFENARVRNSAIVIDTTIVDGNDTITITSANNAHGNTSLSIDTGVFGFDTLSIDGGAAFQQIVGASALEVYVHGAIEVAAQQLSIDANRVHFDIGTFESPGYHQLRVQGMAEVHGFLELHLVNGYVPFFGEQFTIIDNDGFDPMAGGFAGLPQGGFQNAGSAVFQIDYFGGDGNDVVLTAVAILPPVIWDVIWDGEAGDNNWHTPLNWNTNALPAAADNVLIPDVDGAPTILSSEAVSVRSLGSSELVRVTASTFTLAEASFFEAGLEITGGTFTAHGTTTLGGVSTWTGGTIAGSVTNTGTLTLSGSSHKTLDATATLTNAGVIQHGGTGLLVLSVSSSLGTGTTIINQPGALYDLQSDADVDWTSGSNPEPIFQNLGTVRKSGGTGLSFIDQLQNLGGTIEVLSSELELRSFDGTHNGSTGGHFHVAAGATLDLTGDPGGYDVGQYQGTYTGSGEGTVLLDSGTLDAGSGAVFNLPATLFQWTDGSINGALTNVGELTLSGPAAKILLSGSVLTNVGTIKHAGTGLLVMRVGSTLDNQADALYDLQSDADVDWTTGTSPEPFFKNSGTVRKSDGTGLSFIDQLQNLGGTIEVLTGELELRSFDGTTNVSTGGHLIVAAGASLDLTGDPGTLDVGQYQGTYTGSGEGTVLLDNGTLNVGGGAVFNLPGSLFQWTGGTIAEGTLTNQGVLTLAGSAIKAVATTGVLVNANTIRHTGTGSLVLRVGAVVNNELGALYDLQGDGNVDWVSGTSPQPFFNNAGTFRKSSAAPLSFIDQLQNLGGTIEVLLGELELRSFDGTTNTSTGGSFSVAPGAVLDLTGDSSSYDVGRYHGTYSGSGTGTVLLDNGMLDAAGGALFDLPGSLFHWTSGDILGAFNNAQGLTLSEGISSGFHISGAFTQVATGELRIDAGNSSEAPIHDHLQVLGTVALDGALSISPLDIYPLTPFSRFTIIDNDDTDPVVGNFAGLPEGAELPNFLGTDFDASISYVGGDGNDVVITVLEPLSTTISLDGSGNLVIDDTGGDSDDLLTIWSDVVNAVFIISDPNNLLTTSIAGAAGDGTNTLTIPFAAVTGLEIIFDTLDGDDSLTVDFSLGNFDKAIRYDGGSQAFGDVLALVGGPLGGDSFASVTHTFANAHDGTVAVAGNSLITYSGLEPIYDSLSAVDRIFTFEGGDETITLGDADDAAMTIDSTLGESVTFANPSGSLIINAGSGDDSVIIASMDAGYAASLAVTAEAVAVLGGASVTAGVTGTINLTADAVAIDAAAALSASMVTIQPQTPGRPIDLGTESTGSLSLTDVELNRLTADAVEIGSPSAGDITVSAGIDLKSAPTLQLVTGGAIIDGNPAPVDGSFGFAFGVGAGRGNDIGYAVATDSSGNVYVAGAFSGLIDFDPGPGAAYLVSATAADFATDAFVAKYSPSGSLIWARSIGGASASVEARALAVDDAGNVYLTGQFNGTADFDPGAGVSELISTGSTPTSFPTSDIFVAKLDSDGNFLYARALGGTGEDQGNSIVVGAAGNVSVTGFFSGTADFDPSAGTHNLTSAGGTDIFVAQLDATGALVHAVRMGGTSNDEGLGIAADSSGNVYTTGFFAGTADFDPDVGTSNLTSAGSTDIFVSQLDSGGNLIWARRIGGTSNDRGHGIALDGFGNVHTTGYFRNTADFDPGAGTFNLTSAGSNDVFVSKLSNAGDFIWARRLGGPSTAQDEGHSIAVDSSGHVYTTGYFRNTGDFDPGAGTFNLTSAGADEIFVSELDSAGNFVYAKRMGSAGNDAGYGIAVDAFGNVLTTGQFATTGDFDPGTGTFNLAGTGQDVFVSRLDATGNFSFAVGFGAPSNFTGAEGYGFAVATDGAHVYVAGFFSGAADFDPGTDVVPLTSGGSHDVFVAKYTTAGTLVWARRLGGIAEDWAYGIAVDGAGNVYTTGYFSGTADFDPGVGDFLLSSNGGKDAFISKLDAAGNFVWARALGGASEDVGRGIAVDGAGNVYTGGYFSGTVDFDPGLAAFNLTSAGGKDIFVSKLDAAGNHVWAGRQGGVGDDEAHGIALDVSANVHTTGYFSSTADFDPGSAAFDLVSAGGRDIFVSKLDAAGNLVWAGALGGSRDDEGNGIAVDGAGNVFTTGGFRNIADFDPGAGSSTLITSDLFDIFVSKLDAAGNFVFARQFGETYELGAGQAVAVDRLGNVYTTGSFAGTVDFDPGPGTSTLTAVNWYDVFVSKLDSSGNFVYARGMGGADSNPDEGNGIAVDGSENVYTTGYFRFFADFDPGPGTTQLNSVGSADIFVSKLTGPAIDLRVTNLLLQAGTGAGAGDALETAVSNLAAATATGDIQLTNRGELAIATVGGISGVAGGGGVSIAAESLLLENPVTATAAVHLTADTGLTLSGPDAAITSIDDVTLTIGSGGIRLDAGSDAPAHVTASRAVITSGGVIPGHIGAVDKPLRTAVASLSVDTSGSGSNQFLSEADGLTALNLHAGSGAIELTAGGIISDQDADTDVTAAMLVMVSGGIGTSSMSLETVVNALEAVGGSGGVFLSNTGDLTIGGIGATSGVSASNAGISIAAASSITVTEPISSGGGSVSLVATEHVTLSGSSADVATAGGTLAVSADSDGDGIGKFHQDDADSAVTTSSGSVSITAVDVALTGTIDAGAGTVTFLHSRTGSRMNLGASSSARVFPAAINLGSLDGTSGFRLDGVDALDRSGAAVRSAGDVNGDGWDDVIIGAPFANAGSGEAYVVFGRAGGFPTLIDLASLDGTNGFRLEGSSSSAVLAGYSVSSANVNGDGFDDLLIGAPSASGGGEVYVVFGQASFAAVVSLATLDGTTGFTLRGSAGDFDQADRAGSAVSSAGDINGDGFDDVIIGAPHAGYAGPHGYYYYDHAYARGRVYVLFGKGDSFSPTIDLATLNGADGFRFDGEEEGDYAGGSVSTAGDINGDGLDDLVVGAAGGNKSYVIFGSTTGFSDLASLDGTNGFRIDGLVANDYVGSSVSSAGDINGDGLDDLVVGAPSADTSGGTNAGQSYLLFGKDVASEGDFSSVFELATLDGTNGFRIDGLAAGDAFGQSVSSAGDINGDGLDDLVIGASSADTSGGPNAGSSYVIFGRATGFAAAFDLTTLDGTNGFRLDGVALNGFSGSSVSSAGDLDGDGLDELLIGAPDAAVGAKADAGQTYVVFGFDEWTLTDAEIDRVTAAKVIVGDNTVGEVLVTGHVSPAGTSALQIVSGGTIQTTDAENSITVATLDLFAATGIGASDEIGLDTDNLSAELTGNGPVRLREAGSTQVSRFDAGAGTVTLEEGVFLVTGSTSAASTIQVNGGATLGGTGTVGGPVNVADGGTVAPGLSPGILHTGSVHFVGGSTFAVEIGGSTPGNTSNHHDQLNVTGTVTIDTAGEGVSLSTLSFDGFVPTVGQEFVLIDNDGSDPIAGAFAGGTTIPNFLGNGLIALINYAGGDGNDVVLTVVAPGTTTADLDGQGNLRIDDTGGGDTDDTLTIWSDTANSIFIISDPNNLLTTTIAGATGDGTHTLTIPFAAVTGSEIIFHTLGGDDSLTVDYSLGNFGKALRYDGGTQGAVGDTLTTTGGIFEVVEYDVVGPGTGTLSWTGSGAIHFTGLEPLAIASDVGTVIIDVDAAGVVSGLRTIEVSDAGSGNLFIDLDGTLEDLTVAVPTVELRILGDSDSNDTITITSVPGSFGAALTIDGRGHVSGDSVQLQAALHLGAAGNSGNLDVTAETINVHANVTTQASGSAGDVRLVGTTIVIGTSADIDTTAAASGNVSLAAARNIMMDTGTSVTVANGDIDLIANSMNGSGDFIGINLIGATLTSTGSGYIHLEGTGGQFAGAPASLGLMGVFLSGASVSTTGEGDIEFVGTGGVGTDIRSAGVQIHDGSTVSSLTGNINVIGTGGGGTFFVEGVGIQDSLIVSVDGLISVIGQGGAGIQTFNSGVRLFRNVSDTGIRTTGTGSIHLEGTAGTGTGSNWGVSISGTDVVHASGTGNVVITGRGLDTVTNEGIQIGEFGVASLVNAGTGTTTLIADSMRFAPGNVTIDVGANALTLRQETDNRAINLGGTDSAAQLGLTDAELDCTTAGLLQIGNADSGNILVSAAITHGNNLSLTTGGGITLSQALSLAADRSLTAISLSTTTGIHLAHANADVATSGTGGVAVTATRNVALVAGSSITTVNGDILLNANQQMTATGGSFIGVDVNNAIVEATGSGTVTVQGRGGNSGTNQFGVLVQSGGKISGGTSGTSTIRGTGGASTSNWNYGVWVWTNSLITSRGGDIEVHGQGGGAGSGLENAGVVLSVASQIAAGGTGTVSVHGVGGSTSTGSRNFGVWVTSAGSAISSSGGDVSITGTGGGAGTSADNYGVYVNSAGQIAAGAGGLVTVTGVGGDTSGGADHGVFVTGTDSQITSSGGDVDVTGHGRGAGADNDGVVVADAAAILAGNNVQVTASGGGTSHAIFLLNNGLIGSGGNADVTLIADSLHFFGSPTFGRVDAGTGTVTILPRTAGTLVNLGGADVTSSMPLTLGLSDLELDRVTAGEIVIGDETTGVIRVSSEISRPSSTDMQLISGDDLVISGGQIITGGGALLLDAGPSPAAVRPTHAGVDVSASKLSFGSDLAIVIDGTTPDTEYSQLVVVGSVDLTGVELVLLGSYIPTVEDRFVIVDNDGTDAIIGPFNGLPEGEFVSVNGALQQITYLGGDGNDVALLTPLDFGDAPDSYGTLLASNGARHVATGPTLGATRDAEPDAAVPLDGSSDDFSGEFDEDGVFGLGFDSPLQAGSQGSVTVFIEGGGGNARLYAWVDFNQDGDFTDAGEQVALGDVLLADGEHMIDFDVPLDASAGFTYARFRVSTQAGLSFDGLANDGEVEDYFATVRAAAVDDVTMTLQGLPTVIGVLCNDVGGHAGDLDPSSLIVGGGPAHGSVVIHADGTITYQPDPDFVGEDSFTYQVADFHGALSNSALVTVYVVAPGSGLVITPLYHRDPAILADNITGGSVEISNVAFLGTCESAGTFIGGTDSIGFESGIVLSTGWVVDARGPNTQEGITTQNDLAGDADLNTLVDVGDFTFDATVLEFDFVAVGETLQFRYVFSSEEYNEYVFSFNDVFGFFLDGVNIALLPDSQTVVSIDTVNLEVNSDLYRNNDSASGAPLNTQMDGLTVEFVATARVTPGQTHHIKLAIADTNDQSLDSNVFIQIASFTTNSEPTAGDDTFPITEGMPATFDVLANDNDPDGDPLMVTLVANPAHGDAVVNPDGTITYTPNADYFGTDSFTYAIDDGRGGTDSTEVLVLVVSPVETSPAIITVNSTADTNLRDNFMTFREALLVNNRSLLKSELTPAEQAQIRGVSSAFDTDTIWFNIVGDTVHTIQPLTALPTITDPVIIDGYTQPGASPNTNPVGQGLNTVLLIELNGASAGSNSDGLTIAASASGTAISGLAINRFTGDGISMLVGSNGNVVAGNFIGTNAAGTVGLGNQDSGVYVLGDGNTIGGTTPAARNLISGNGDATQSFNGIRLEFADHNVVQGNVIGLDITGVHGIANNGNGISDISGAFNVFGGTAAGAGNLISGNVLNGIVVQDVAGATVASGTHTVIQGNRIGTDVTGTLDGTPPASISTSALDLAWCRSENDRATGAPA